MSRSRNWIVSISSENDDPRIYGPYTKATAKVIAAKVQGSIDAQTDDQRRGNFLHAGAYEITPATVTEIRANYDLKRVSS